MLLPNSALLLPEWLKRKAPEGRNREMGSIDEIGLRCEKNRGNTGKNFDELMKE